MPLNDILGLAQQSIQQTPTALGSLGEGLESGMKIGFAIQEAQDRVQKNKMLADLKVEELDDKHYARSKDFFLKAVDKDTDPRARKALFELYNKSEETRQRITGRPGLMMPDDSLKYLLSDETSRVSLYDTLKQVDTLPTADAKAKFTDILRQSQDPWAVANADKLAAQTFKGPEAERANAISQTGRETLKGLELSDKEKARIFEAKEAEQKQYRDIQSRVATNMGLYGGSMKPQEKAIFSRPDLANILSDPTNPDYATAASAYSKALQAESDVKGGFEQQKIDTRKMIVGLAQKRIVERVIGRTITDVRKLTDVQMQIERDKQTLKGVKIGDSVGVYSTMFNEAAMGLARIVGGSGVISDFRMKEINFKGRTWQIGQLIDELKGKPSMLGTVDQEAIDLFRETFDRLSDSNQKFLKTLVGRSVGSSVEGKTITSKEGQDIYNVMSNFDTAGQYFETSKNKGSTTSKTSNITKEQANIVKQYTAKYGADGITKLESDLKAKGKITDWLNKYRTKKK